MVDELVGKTLGRYRLEAPIGRGRIATVYRASDPFGAAPVAVTMIAPASGAGAWFCERFVRAIRPFTRLQHPAILPIHEVGDRDGAVFLVTPLLPGGTLRDRLGVPLTVAEAVALLRPVAEALDYLHAQRLIHGDVRPANILLTAEGRPLLADCGIARAQEEAGGLATGLPSAIPVGEPEYRSPEQAQNAPLDSRADLYSLGVILFEALTGRPPFQAGPGDDAASIAARHLAAPPPSPRNINPALDLATEAVLLKALAKYPYERYAPGAALFDALAGTALTPAEVTPLPAAIPANSAVYEPVPLSPAPPVVPVPSAFDVPVSAAAPTVPPVESPTLAVAPHALDLTAAVPPTLDDPAELATARAVLVNALATIRERRSRTAAELSGARVTLAGALAQVQVRQARAVAITGAESDAVIPIEPDWREEYQQSPDLVLKKLVTGSGLGGVIFFVIIMAFVIRDLSCLVTLLVLAIAGAGFYLLVTPTTSVVCHPRGVIYTQSNRLGQQHGESLRWREVTGLRYFETRHKRKNGGVMTTSHFAVDWRGGQLFSLTGDVEGFPQLIATFNRMTPHLAYQWVAARHAGDAPVLEQRGDYWKVARAPER